MSMDILANLFNVGFISIVLGIALLAFALYKWSNALVKDKEIEEKWRRLKRDIEVERKEASLKLKDDLHKRKSDFEMDMKRERLDLERFQGKLNNKSENLEKKEDRLDQLGQELQQKERELTRLTDRVRLNEEKLKSLYSDLLSKLEKVASLTREDARKELTDTLKAEVRLSNEQWIAKVEEDTKGKAKDRSVDIIVTAMQRYTAENVSPHTSGIVHLPNEEMKGRIIGKEGRNIKALEMATGMEFIIEKESPDITISGFNPVRREITKRALEKLVADGRINPTRIEETVGQCEAEIDEIIQEYGKNTVLEFNLQGIHPEIVTLLGKLHFRTSFTQNVLMHCKEVGLFSRMIAEELGLDGSIALRGGLLHDIGKAVTAEVEGPHALIGADIAKRCGEIPEVVNMIAAHHEEVPFTSVYSPIVVIADTISASRPGARHEALAAYIKRVEKLEEIALSFGGIKKAFALQAGREVRVIVEEEMLDDDKAFTLAHDIARKIEEEMAFPGQIKINVIREKRSIEYAR